MLEVIEKLLILQDRDRRIADAQAELAQIEPQRRSFTTRAESAQGALEAAKLRVKQLESDRKKLELDVEAQKQLIERYSNQQLQTRKNEEYRALAHEIETCQQAIRRIEDQELEIMEQSDAAQRQVTTAIQTLAETNQLVTGRISDLRQREEQMQRELATLESNRAALAAAVDDSVRTRYERLFKSKGGSVVVGVDHGVCGGCHMRVPAQLLVHCRAQQEIVTCQNCGRVLYFTRDMDMLVAD